MSGSDIEAVKKSVRTYLMVFGSLMVLTLATVAAASVHLAVPFAVTVALVIAVVKGSLVASFFMHLAHERRLIYWALLLTAAFFIFLMLIPLLTMADRIQLR